MTKEALADKIRQLLDQHVNAFVDQKSEAAIAAGKRSDELEKQKQLAAKTFGEDTAAYRGAVREIEREQTSLVTDSKSDQKANRRAAAEAFVIACNHWRLPLTTRKQPGRTASSSTGTTSGSGSRLNRQQMEEAAGKVLAVLPPSNTSAANCKAPTTVAEESGLPVPTVKSVLMKLKRDGKAESNGMRGLAGGWRKAKAS